MENAASILVIILASVLTIFMILAIVALAYVVKLLKSLRHIAKQAERLVDSAEAVGEVFKNTSGPLAAIRLMSNIVKMVQRDRSKQGRD